MHRSESAGPDEATKSTVQKLPLLTVKAGPRDGEEWTKRMKEEYMALIAYQKVNKEAGNEWFTIESNKTGTRWTGKVWYMHELLKYEFDLEFELPVAYPNVAPELALPELDGKTEKMYRGGKICLDSHFRPLWARNVPHFGIAHAMALGVRAASSFPLTVARLLSMCAYPVCYCRRWAHGLPSRFPL